MKNRIRRNILGALIVVATTCAIFLSSLPPKLHAACNAPNGTIYYLAIGITGPQYVHIDSCIYNTVSTYLVTSANGPIGSYSWTATGPAIPNNGSSSSFSTEWSDYGKYKVSCLVVGADPPVNGPCVATADIDVNVLGVEVHDIPDSFELGSDLPITYELKGPAGFTFTSVDVKITNRRGGVVVFRPPGPVPTGVGTYNITWPKGRWNQGGYTDYANPYNGPYCVEVTATAGSSFTCKDDRETDTVLVLRADLKDDKPAQPLSPSANIATGLDTPGSKVKVDVIFGGSVYVGGLSVSEVSPVYTDLDGDGVNDLSSVTVKCSDSALNYLANNGIYTMRINGVYDKAGNPSDQNLVTIPVEWFAYDVPLR